MRRSSVRIRSLAPFFCTDPGGKKSKAKPRRATTDQQFFLSVLGFDQKIHFNLLRIFFTVSTLIVRCMPKSDKNLLSRKSVLYITRWFFSQKHLLCTWLFNKFFAQPSGILKKAHSGMLLFLLSRITMFLRLPAGHGFFCGVR